MRDLNFDELDQVYGAGSRGRCGYGDSPRPPKKSKSKGSCGKGSKSKGSKGKKSKSKKRGTRGYRC